MSVRTRLTLWYGGILALALALTGLALLVVFDRAVGSQTDADLAARAQTAVTAFQSGSEPDEQFGHSDEPLSVRDTIVLALDADGSVLASNVALGPGERAIAAAATRRGAPAFETIALGGRPVRIHSVPLTRGSVRSGTLVVGRSIAALEEARARLAATLLLLLPGAFGLATAGGYLLARRALRPVDDLRRRADEIVDLQDLDRRLAPDPRDDEVGRLGRTLDGMLERIAGAVEQQRRFTADASHELRTPLAAILGDVSLALSRPRTPSDYRAALERAQTEATRLASIVDALLTISRADAGALAAHTAPTDLAEVASLAVERSEASARERRVEIRLHAESRAIVRADADALGRVADNLIDNALRYGSRTEVTVGVTRRGDRAVLTVEDDGPGFTPALLPQAFERFRRGAAPGVDGSGLGLAIVEAIARAYGGSTRAENVPGSGARVTVELPVAT